MSLVKRIFPTLIVGLIVVLAAEAHIALADSVEEGAPTETLTLLPGDNFVGWVAEQIAVDEILEAIPAASLIYRWDADTRRWHYAARDAGGTLETLQPGMAVKIRIDGRKAVQWERPLTPAKGMVTLYSGENWVAWNGRDEWPLDQVARGVGKSLVSIEVRGLAYQPDSDIAESVEPLSGDTTIRRGDALRVTVNRDVRWLQPTGVMPKVVFVGDTPQSLQEEITADIRRVLDFFAEEFAIETDFSDTSILVWHGLEAALEYQASGAEPRWPGTVDQVRTRLQHSTVAESTSWGFTLPACLWQPPCILPSGGERVAVVSHEWFHYMQTQLSGLPAWEVITWLAEGAATWSEWLLPAELRHTPYEDDRKQRLDATARTTVTLESTEKRNGGWAYRLGAVPAEQLVELNDVDAHFEFSRQQLQQVVGESRTWVKTPTWQEAFHAAFGLPVTEFYRQFASWRETLAPPAQRYDYDRGDVTLAGTLKHHDGSPAEGFRFNATQYVDGVETTIDRGIFVDDQGAFSVDLPPQTNQRIQFERDACTVWLTNEGLTTMRPQPGQYRDLDTRNLAELNLTLPEGACENQLSVNILRLRGDDRRVEVNLNSEEGNTWTSARLDRFGFYTAYAPESGGHRVRVVFGGCVMWYSKAGLVASRSDGDVLELSEKPVSIEARTSHSQCVRKIGGRIVKEDGAPVKNVWAFASGNGTAGFANSGVSGEFSITVPESDTYGLSFGTDVAGCRISYATSGATSDWRQATSITVDDEDVTGIEFVVPADPSSLCR